MKKNQAGVWCLAILSVFVISSCATIFSGSKAKIIVEDDDVSVPVDLTIDGKKYHDIYLPARVRIKRGFTDSKITANAPGYQESTIYIDKKFNATTLFNIIWGGIPGLAIDAATGAMMKPEFNNYNLNMQFIGGVAADQQYKVAYEEDPTIVADEADNMVSRDNPGQTALERTIIRWYFDSDPQGARIFWRVISSIPSEVKNTNELYLMTTPYEETRSFNILGLTYENSRDVQIEIKVTKKGYETQVKRFNVRQVIDQQEISSFFELVPKEE